MPSAAAPEAEPPAAQPLSVLAFTTAVKPTEGAPEPSPGAGTSGVVGSTQT